MYKDTNRKILEEINRLKSLRRGEIIGRNSNGETILTSLGRFHSETLGMDLHLGLKEYSGFADSDTLVALELGLIDLVEGKLPHLVQEFPLFHGVFLDPDGKPAGVITEDFSRGRTVPVEPIGQIREDLPYEIQELIGRPKDLYELATTSFLAGGERRIGDLGAFTRGNVLYQMEIGKNYFDSIVAYSVRVPLV